MKKKKITHKKDKSDRMISVIIAAAVIFTVLTLGYSVKTMLFAGAPNDQITTQAATMQVPAGGKMTLTSYDKELAKKMMDKNNDGKCDACGMPVDMCIDSGMMQCSGMDPDATMGILESQHIHADWKIYINGEILSFEGKDHMGRIRANLPVSSFIHVDSGAPAPEKVGDVLHMHATGVPLWIFFESLDLELSNGIKIYVNGKEIGDWKNYVFNDLDKLLITDGTGNLEEQLNSITDFAERH